MAASRSISAEDHAASGFEPADSAGLFVGVSQFEDPRFAPVPFAVDDAVDLAHVFSLELGLIRPERCVLALAGVPAKPESVARLAALLAAGAQQKPASFTNVYRLLAAQRAAVRAGGLLVVALATHGLSDQGGDFLVAADSLRERVVKTGVAVDDLFDEIARAGAPRRLVLLDACRERLSTETRGAAALSAMGQRFADAIAKASGQVVLAGATLGGFAYDDLERKNGVFTAAVVDGLRGAAGADARGFITVRTLADYVHEQVVAWVKARRPEHARRSAGIARRIEGGAEALPLAVSPAVKEAAERYQRRREAALERLRQNIGEVITGVLYEQIKGRLPVAGPGAEVEELLQEIEALDGTARSQRSLAYFYREAGHKKPRRNFWLWGTAAAVGLVLLGVWVFGHRSPAAGNLLAGPLGITFRYVPAGTYQIGSPADEPGRFDDEMLHSVVLTSGFWMAETEVTQGQWKGLMGSNPSKFSQCGDICPVENVSWFEAVDFANRLSRWEGLKTCYNIDGEDVQLESPDCNGYRLPTEAEWEVAARADQKAAIYAGDFQILGAHNAPALDPIAWYGGNSAVSYEGSVRCSEWEERQYPAKSCGPHPVKTRKPNPWQLHDMLGNVWEWTWDRYVPYPPAGVPDPLGPRSGLARVVRGGSWGSGARSLRAAVRAGVVPDVCPDDVGFRLARGQLRQE